jgi:hypothetical protein
MPALEADRCLPADLMLIAGTRPRQIDFDHRRFERVNGFGDWFWLAIAGLNERLKLGDATPSTNVHKRVVAAAKLPIDRRLSRAVPS